MKKNNEIQSYCQSACVYVDIGRNRKGTRQINKLRCKTKSANQTNKEVSSQEKPWKGATSSTTRTPTVAP